MSQIWISHPPSPPPVIELLFAGAVAENAVHSARVTTLARVDPCEQIGEIMNPSDIRRGLMGLAIN